MSIPYKFKESQPKNELKNDYHNKEGVDCCYLDDSSTEMENYEFSNNCKNCFKPNDLENKSDIGDNDNNIKLHLRRNSHPDECSDDYDTDEIHVEGLVGKLKSKRVKELEAQLTRDQLEEEKRIEREQLAAIFELLKKQEAELNMKEIDETELTAQLALYR